MYKYTVQDMHKLAASRGFEFLSTEYKGVMEKHEWKCQKGDVWSARPSDIKNGGGCPYCFGRYKDINKIKNDLAIRYIVLLSDQYHVVYYKYSCNVKNVTIFGKAQLEVLFL